jgi:uncharacterized protein
MADPYLPWLIAAIALVFGLTSGLAVSASGRPSCCSERAVVRHGRPAVRADIGFYLFQLPFWVRADLAVHLAGARDAADRRGALPARRHPTGRRGDKVLPAVKAHLSVLLALILAVRGWGYWLDRYASTTRRGAR